jgi:hypothetical protein
MSLSVENVVWVSIGQRNKFVDGKMPEKKWYPSSFCMYEQCWRDDYRVDSDIVELIFNTVANAPVKDVMKFALPEIPGMPKVSVFRYCTETTMYSFMVKED